MRVSRFRQRGKQKARGPCGATRALRESRRNIAASFLLRSRWHARGHGRTRAIARPARCLSALGLSVVAMSCRAFQSSSFRYYWSCANAAVSAALTSKNKKPGALSRSGLVKMHWRRVQGEGAGGGVDLRTCGRSGKLGAGEQAQERRDDGEVGIADRHLPGGALNQPARRGRGLARRGKQRHTDHERAGIRDKN